MFMLDFISLTVSNKTMFKKCFVSLVVLWSWQNAAAVVHNPFEFFNAQMDQKNSDVCSSKALKMPPMRSQDSLPICTAFSSAAVVQYQVCKKMPGACKDGVPTSGKFTVSPLSTLAWTRTNDGTGVQGNSSNFENLQFYYSGTTGASEALQNASFTPTFFAESCFPFDQFANNEANPKFGGIEGIIKVIESEYKKAKLEGDGLCEDCLRDSPMVGAANALGISSDKIKEKLVEAKTGKATPGQFLHKLMLENCPDLISFRPSQKLKFDSFPKDAKDLAYQPMIEKIKEVLKVQEDGGTVGNPLTLDNICIEFKSDGTCKSFHSVAITGYRKVCKNVSSESIPENDKKERCAVQCRDVLKVHNSWGGDWQRAWEKKMGLKEGDGEGWVDAKQLTEYMTKNKNLMKNALAWYY